MKTAEEVFKEMSVGNQTATRWIELVKQAQAEAIDEAILRCSYRAPLEELEFSLVGYGLKKELGL